MTLFSVLQGTMSITPPGEKHQFCFVVLFKYIVDHN